MEELKKYGSSDISDALSSLGHKDYFIPDLKSFGKKDIQQSLVGKVYTVELIETTSELKSELNTNEHWLDNVDENSILLIKQAQGLKNAVFGGLLGTRAQNLNLKGVVALGYIRDSLELEESGLNTLAFGISVLSSKGYTKAYKVKHEVEYVVNEYHKAVINYKDILFADSDGVLTFPERYLTQVLDLCSKNGTIEEKCKQDLLKGEKLYDTFKKYRE